MLSQGRNVEEKEIRWQEGAGEREREGSSSGFEYRSMLAVAVGPHFEIKFANTSACFMPWPRVFSFCHQICRVGYKSGVYQCAGELEKKTFKSFY